MKKSSIYEIFKCWGLIAKFGGFIPMPGVYEVGIGNSKLVNVILPSINFISQMFCAISLIIFAFINDYTRNLTDILIVASHLFFALWTLTCPFILCFRLSQRLCHYLKLHHQIEALLKPQKNFLKTFTIFIELLFTSFSIYGYVTISYVRYVILSTRYDKNAWYYSHLMTLLLVTSIVAPFALKYSLAQPHSLYVFSHQVLKSAFDELNDRIQTSRRKDLAPEEIARVLREFGQLHIHLCKLSKLLDDLVHPLLFFRYALCIFLIIYRVTSLSSLVNFSPMVGVIHLGLTTALPAIFAQRTTISASKIMPSLYNFNLNDKNAKFEIKVLGLQHLQLKHTFSASGIINLNGDLINTLLQTIVSYCVIFYNFNKPTK